MSYLLDANALFALVWPLHRYHATIQHWMMTGLGDHRWATTQLTQLAVLRLLLNPQVTQGVFSSTSAHSVLTGLQSHPKHELWPPAENAVDQVAPLVSKIRGHNQWNDAVLLRQAVDRQGVLVTFDSGIEALARGAWEQHLLLLRPLATPP